MWIKLCSIPLSSTSLRKTLNQTDLFAFFYIFYFFFFCSYFILEFIYRFYFSRVFGIYDSVLCSFIVLNCLLRAWNTKITFSKEFAKRNKWNSLVNCSNDVLKPVELVTENNSFYSEFLSFFYIYYTFTAVLTNPMLIIFGWSGKRRANYFNTSTFSDTHFTTNWRRTHSHWLLAPFFFLCFPYRNNCHTKYRRKDSNPFCYSVHTS